MTEVEPALDFASSGRSGRRNALPDILGSPAGVNPSDLPLKLAELSLTGKSNDTYPHMFVFCALTCPVALFLQMVLEELSLQHHRMLHSLQKARRRNMDPENFPQ